MNFADFLRTYQGLSLAWQVMIPLAILLVIAFHGLLLWAAARASGHENFTYLKSLAVAAAEQVVLFGLSWGMAIVFANNPGTAAVGTSSGVTLAASLAMVTGMLVVLGPMSVLQGIVVWAVRFVINLHLAALLLGIFFTGVGVYYASQPAGAVADSVITTNFTAGTLFLLGALAGILVLMGAALANAERMTFLRCLALGWIELVILVPLFYAGYGLVHTSFPEMTTLLKLLVTLGGVTGVSLVVFVTGCMLLSGTSIVRSLLVWLLRLPLYVLMASLTLGLVFVGLSVVQIAQGADGAQVLEWIALGLMGATALAIFFFVGAQLLTPTVGVRRSAA